MAKFIFITGGVVSSLGKGITAASIGQILKSRGLKVFIQKFDPYINVDPGTMSPYQHGEVFVTDDGAETDLDLGHYERFIDENLSKYSSVSTGKIYSSVIEKEREGMYNGATIQVIPHITDEIKQKLVDAAKYSNADVIITEIGGTVGDIESLPYLESIRQARRDFGYKNTIYIHNTLVPYLRAAKEIKTKPTQHSVKELRSLGIQPDILVLRSEVKVPQSSKDKIALFSDIPTNAVFESLDVDVIYQIILDMKKQKVDDFILEHFRITDLPEPDLSAWEGLITKIRGLEKKVNIALVGKYISLQDAYLSLVESLRHSGYHHNVEINIKWIDSSTLTPDNIVEQLGDCSGIVVPGGFGKEATAGKVLAINYARVNNVPFLGICFGMQLALIEYARNVFKLENATSREIEHEATNQLIDRNKNHEYRKGSFVTIIDEKSKLNEIYGTNIINERYRHKFSFNFDYKEIYEKDKNVLLSSFTNNNEILSSFELVNHPWFIAVQYHPEFLSRPLKAHPLFNSFVKELIK